MNHNKCKQISTQSLLVRRENAASTMGTQTRRFLKRFSENCLTLHLSQETGPLKGCNAPCCWEHGGKKQLAKTTVLEITFWDFSGQRKYNYGEGEFLLDQMLGMVWEMELYGEF